MNQEMTPRERMIAALSNKTPDRIPASPDISNMVPCRLTGKPFWDIYVNNDPPLWRAYLDAVRYFGMDGWFMYGELEFRTSPRIPVAAEVARRTDDRWDVKKTYHTPLGDLTELTACPRRDPPTPIEKLVKDFKADFGKYKCLFSKITGYNGTVFRQQKKELGELGIMGCDVNPPGLFYYTDFFHGSLEAAAYAYYDYPELFEELRELHEKQALRQVELFIDAGTDSILTGGSGAITLQSPEIWRALSLPTLKKIIALCHQAGVISGIHTCGKEFIVVKTCAEETELNYINPLEIPPMGDCNLKECKDRFGGRLALMGNLHTTDVMLRGSPEDIRRETLKCMLDAGGEGGFVMSTGDQCGRDTPDENIFSLVETVKQFGRYPLDRNGILEEYERLCK